MTSIVTATRVLVMLDPPRAESTRASLRVAGWPTRSTEWRSARPDGGPPPEPSRADDRAGDARHGYRLRVRERGQRSRRPGDLAPRPMPVARRRRSADRPGAPPRDRPARG